MDWGGLWLSRRRRERHGYRRRGLVELLRRSAAARCAYVAVGFGERAGQAPLVEGECGAAFSPTECPPWDESMCWGWICAAFCTD